MILETFIRCFVNPDALDATVEFYKSLLGGEESLRFDYPETGLKLASVSSPHLSVLVIAGEADKRKPFEATRLTIKVSSLEDYAAILKSAGAELLDPIQNTLVGRKMRYRHKDGLIVEYVQHG
jgi:glyoxalase/bleomycin resistance protein/dioxygenase superfamily protein